MSTLKKWLDEDPSVVGQSGRRPYNVTVPYANHLWGDATTMQLRTVKLVDEWSTKHPSQWCTPAPMCRPCQGGKRQCTDPQCGLFKVYEEAC